MFDFKGMNKDTVEAKIIANRAKTEAHVEAMRMLSELMLDSDIPETAKAAIRIVNASKDMEMLIHDAATEVGLKDENINIENAKKYILMLTACTNQLKAFLESNPLIEDTEK